ASLLLQETRALGALSFEAQNGVISTLLPVILAAPSGGLYIGPQAHAPQQVVRPWLLILRNPGAPAGQTAIVVREP
ncbi:MAG: hypothetical protein ACREUF_04625, partial [Solimonas sp.]